MPLKTNCSSKKSTNKFNKKLSKRAKKKKFNLYFDPKTIDQKGTRTIFIGGIDVSANSDLVKRALYTYVNPKDVEHIEVVKRSGQKVNLGFAFLIMKSDQQVSQFLEKDIIICSKKVSIIF